MSYVFTSVAGLQKKIASPDEDYPELTKGLLT